ncbi:MAG TPA: hypothetical protein VLK37_03640 [Solirubrobacterales bacterium]|nr:hypothetical protein [Solirubrobacterales bacterium]
MRARAIVALASIVFALLATDTSVAAGPPQVVESWATDVTAISVNLRAKINPAGAATTYRFEYLTQTAYEASGGSFGGASLAPPSGAASLGGGSATIGVVQHLGSLNPGTAYRYRVRATNAAGTEFGPERVFATAEPTNLYPPIDGRGWELVSPVDKDGGAVGAPESIFGGGDFQAAADGESFTFSSTSSFGEAAGAPPASQYVSAREGSGWTTRNVSVPLESGGYGDRPDGTPYRVFSEDLGRALMRAPRRCEAGEECRRGYSLRETANGTLTPLPAAAAGMRVLSVSPDLDRILLEDEAGEVFAWSGGGLVPSEAPAEPDPGGVVVGVLGASAAGDIIYFQDATGLKRRQNGVTTTIVAGPDAAAPSDWPAATGTSRVSADGEHLAFLSAAEIPPYDNRDANTGQPVTELYLYGPPPGGGATRLICASCNPSGERPQGPASIPGAVANGSTALYRPRVLSANGNRVFFDTADRLVPSDTNSRPDVYEWEATGIGDCRRVPGCVGLVSGGRGEGGRFLDASADGRDAFFLSGESLVGADPGSIDVYDGREGGGFPEPAAPFACKGDACQALPSPPDDLAPATLAPTSGNPPLRIEKPKQHHCPRGKVRRKGRCVKAHRGKRHPRRGGRR